MSERELWLLVLKFMSSKIKWGDGTGAIGLLDEVENAIVKVSKDGINS